MEDQTPHGHDDAAATSPPPPPPGPSPSGAPQEWTAGAAAASAGLPKRFLARVIDALVVGIPLGIVLIVVADLDATRAAYAIITAIVNLGYFVLLESSQGATLGKRMLGMSVRADGGATPTTEQAFRRNWWLLLGLVPLIGGLASLAVTIYIAITIASDERNRGWHDKLADAVVLDR